MALVQKLNVVLTIDDELIDTYLNKGYNIIDESGRVIKEAMPDDPNQLKMMVAKYKKENEELKAKIAELQTKKEVKVETPKEVKAEPVIVEAPVEEKVEVPHRKPKKSSNKK